MTYLSLITVIMAFTLLAHIKSEGDKSTKIINLANDKEILHSAVVEFNNAKRQFERKFGEAYPQQCPTLADIQAQREVA